MQRATCGVLANAPASPRSPSGMALQKVARCLIQLPSSDSIIKARDVSAAAAPMAGHTRPIVAIDGPAACGKGTCAKSYVRFSTSLILDTGLLYRAVGHKAVKQAVALDDEDRLVQLCGSLSAADLAEPGLRGDDAAQAASKVSVIQRVRTALGEYPRQFAATPPAGSDGAVLDGRDVGTVLCPHADVKLFLTAIVEVRAQRRLLELISRGMVPQGDVKAQEEMRQKVLQDLQERDRRDSSRAAAPLRAAEDAHILDSSSMNADEVLEAAVAIIEAACPELRRQAAVVA